MSAEQKQKTLAGEAVVEGIGLHTGTPCVLTLKPAAEGQGLRFVRVDLPGKTEIPARVEWAAGADRGTTLTKDGASVTTVEHVLSALHGMGVDNATIEMTGPEPPENDGSALPFVQAIRWAGIVPQSAPRTFASPDAPAWVQDSSGYVAALASESLRVAYTLDYRLPSPLTMFASFDVTPEVYEKEIAPARTFCFAAEVEKLRAAGLIKGGTEQNAVVFSDDGRPRSELRFPNEPARHKILDLIGDLALAGRPVAASVAACRTGHGANQKLVRAFAGSAGAGESRFPSTDPAVLTAISAKSAWDASDVKKVLPHRHPFLMVDRIVEFKLGEKSVGIKDVRLEEDYFRGHFPSEPVMPGVLILEALAQVGATLVLVQPENIGRLAYFAAVKDAKFRRPVRPGDQLRLEVDKLRMRGHIGTANCHAYVGTELACEGEIWFALGNKQGAA